jgi:hypothetical protein
VDQIDEWTIVVRGVIALEFPPNRYVDLYQGGGEKMREVVPPDRPRRVNGTRLVHFDLDPQNSKSSFVAPFQGCS